MKWFRFYSEARHDPKVQRLPIALRWRWLEILCIASESNPRGTITADVADLAYQLKCRVPATQAIRDQLVSAALLERNGNVFDVHGWRNRQPESDDVTLRVQKHRRNVSETAQIREDQIREDQKRREIDPPTPLALVVGETDMGVVFSLYEKTFGSLTARTKQLVEEAVEQYSGNWVREAMTESAAQSARSWAYAEAILRRWEQDEIAESG